MLMQDKFVKKLTELTENDQLPWRPVEGKYTEDDSYSSEYKGARYELKIRPENSQKLIITCGGETETISKNIELLVRAVLYKEYTHWEIQEHIREVLGEDGIE